MKDQRTPTRATPSKGSDPAAAAEQAEPSFDNSFMVSLLGGGASGSPAQAATAAAAGSDIVKQALRARALFDTDHDGFLSEAELDAAFANPKVTGEMAAMAAALRQHRAEIEELSDDELMDENDGITTKDLRALDTTDGTSLQAQIKSTYDRVMQTAKNTPRKVFEGEPQAGAVRQGQLGDCYFIAALASLVAQRPEDVKKMIVDNGNDTFTVTFPGKKPVTVSMPTDGELATYGTTQGNGLWLTILEKAYGKASNDAAWFKSGVDQEEIGNGGLVSTGVSTVTGGATNTDMLALTSMDTSRARLTEALRARKVVTAAIRKSLPFVEDGMAGGIVMGHVYSVLAYDKSSDMITVRNPWGSYEPTTTDGQVAKDGQDDGQFDLSLADFYEHFSQLCYEQ